MLLAQFLWHAQRMDCKGQERQPKAERAGEASRKGDREGREDGGMEQNLIRP